MPPMTPLEDDPRVRRGMERQFELRTRVIGEGARPIGWKLGLGTGAAMEQHGTSAPLVGFLTDATRLEPGDVVAVGGWGKPTAEPEIAVHVAADLPPAADRETVAAAIAGLGVAIEVVDISGGEVEEILAGDIFHRHVILGPASAGIDASDLRGEIAHGDEMLLVDDPLALVPEPIAAVDPPLGPPGRLRRDRQGGRRADHGVDRARAGDRARRPRDVPARAARGAHARRLGVRRPAILGRPSRRWRNW